MISVFFQFYISVNSYISVSQRFPSYVYDMYSFLLLFLIVENKMKHNMQVRFLHLFHTKCLYNHIYHSFMSSPMQLKSRSDIFLQFGRSKSEYISIGSENNFSHFAFVLDTFDIYHLVVMCVIIMVFL
jgi:hypothetical protein